MLKGRTVAEKNNKLLITALLGFLLFLPPFFRGLYFEQEFHYYHIATAVVFLIYFFCCYKPNRVSQYSLLDISILTFMIAYLLSVTVAVNIRDAVGEVFRYLNYVMIFFMVAFIADSVNSRKLIKVLYFSGVGVCIVGLGAAFGLIKVDGGYEFNQIASTLGYSNSLGGYLLPIFILGLFLFMSEDNRGFKIFYSAGNYVVFLTFIGTVSRGAFLILPVVLIALMVLAPKESRFALIKHVSLVFACVLIFSSKILRTGLPAGRDSSIIWLAAGLVLFTLIVWILEKYPIHGLSLNRKRIIFLFVIITAVFVMLSCVVYVSDLSVKNLLPTRVIEKISSSGFASRNIQERFVFYKDALKIIRDYPLLGTGGGGWVSLCTKYQSYLYSTTKVHSHLFQVWVETGLLGIIAYLYLWVAMTFGARRLLKTTMLNSERLLITAVLMSIIAILLHGLIDFDLSLGAISIMMWSLIAILSGYMRRYSQLSFTIKELPDKILKVMAIFCTLVLMLVSLSFSIAFGYAKKGSEAVDRWILPEAIVNYEKAVKFDPLKASYAADLAQSLHYYGDPVDNFNMVRRAKTYAIRAENLDPYNIKIRIVKAKIQLSLSEIPESVKEYEQVIEIFPYNQTGYDNLAEVYFRVGKYYSLKGNNQEAKKYLEKTKTVPYMIIRQLQKLNQTYRSYWVIAPMLEISPSINNSIKKADELLKQLN